MRLQDDRETVTREAHGGPICQVFFGRGEEVFFFGFFCVFFWGFGCFFFFVCVCVCVCFFCFFWGERDGFFVFFFWVRGFVLCNFFVFFFREEGGRFVFGFFFCYYDRRSIQKLNETIATKGRNLSCTSIRRTTPTRSTTSSRTVIEAILGSP